MTLVPPIQTPSGDAIGPPDGSVMLVDGEARGDEAPRETASDHSTEVAPAAPEGEAVAEGEVLLARGAHDDDLDVDRTDAGDSDADVAEEEDVAAEEDVAEEEVAEEEVAEEEVAEEEDVAEEEHVAEEENVAEEEDVAEEDAEEENVAEEDAEELTAGETGSGDAEDAEELNESDATDDADTADVEDEDSDSDSGEDHGDEAELAPTPPSFQRRSGPLEPAADAAGIIERLWRRVGKEPPPTMASFPAILEDIADVGGSVMMAGVVNAGIPPQDDTPKVDDGRWLIAHVQAQLDAMDRFVTRRLDAPFGPRNGLPSLEKAQASLMSEVLSEDARERAVTDLSRAFGQRLLALMRIVRRDGNRIRADLGPELRSLGGRAAYLERLDTSLRRATAHEMAARDVVLGELVSECAHAAMTQDLATESAADLAQGAILVERWYRRGFVRSLRTEIDGLVRAFAAEERALLTHLANAAIQPVAGEAA